MVRICFVCLGNICRSPTAEGIMQALVRTEGLDDRIRVESAGTLAYHEGELPDRRARATAAARGMELTSRARRFTGDDFDRFDYVIGMDRENRDDLRAMAPDDQADGKVHLFRMFDPDVTEECDVPDPYYGGHLGFEAVFDLCETVCRRLLARLQADLALGADGHGDASGH